MLRPRPLRRTPAAAIGGREKTLSSPRLMSRKRGGGGSTKRLLELLLGRDEGEEGAG